MDEKADIQRVINDLEAGIFHAFDADRIIRWLRPLLQAVDVELTKTEEKL